MIGLLQRVSHAEVVVEGAQIARIGAGLMVLVGVERGDVPGDAERLAERLLNYRVFADAGGRMNLSLSDTDGGLLLVPQFTLSADTRKGNRPGFSSAADPQVARQLFAHLAARAAATHRNVESGQFGADMQVTLTNDGPVTFWLRVPQSPRLCA